MKHISSADNPLFRQIQELLRSSRAREASGIAVIEGSHLVDAYLQSKREPPLLTVLSVADLDHPDIVRVASSLPADRKVAFAARLFARLTPVAGSNGVLAMIPISQVAAAELLGRGGFQLWLDGIQDPGNVGSLIRSAAAAGAAAVVLGPGSADPWSPKCLRAGMGGHFATRVHAARQPLQVVADSFGGRIVAADAAAEESLYETDLSEPVAVVLGNEGQGISEVLAARVHARFRIPMAPRMESLNVAAAGAVICFERVRRGLRVQTRMR